MAVLEAKGPNAESGPRPDAKHDTIAIADLGAIARVRASFQQRIGQYVGGEWLPPNEAYVVRGTVYYIDGYGTVFRMGLDGQQIVVTKFPITLSNEPGFATSTKQEVSFAVSSDGCQLAGTVLTIGPTWGLQTIKATAGGTAEILHTWTSQSQGAPGNLVLVGWDSLGPIAVVGSDLGLIGGPPSPSLKYIANPDFSGGYIAHLAADGTPGARLEPTTCHAAQVSPGGDVTCYEIGAGQAFSVSVVRSTGGTELAPTHVPINGGYAYVAVGPNGLIAMTGSYLGGSSLSPGNWRSQTGASGMLPPRFYPEGWVDAQTIFGRIGDMPPGNAALVRLGSAQPTLEDLGFQGDFVGMLGG